MATKDKLPSFEDIWSGRLIVIPRQPRKARTAKRIREPVPRLLGFPRTKGKRK